MSGGPRAERAVGRFLRKAKGETRQAVVRLRRDRLYRTALLLVGDNLFIGVLGAIFALVATHVWAPSSIGTVAAVASGATLIVTAAGLGMPSTIVAYLVGERDQALLVRGALLLTTGFGVVLLGGLWLWPNHLGVPLGHLGLTTPIAVFLTFGFVAGNLIINVADPALLARQEVSWIVAKDVSAVLIRFIALVAFRSTGTGGFLGVAVIYVVSGAAIDLFVLRRRLQRSTRRRLSLGLGLLRRKARFAVGNQVATIVAMLPTSLLPLFVIARLGAASAAYVAIPMQLLVALTIVPSMTSQSLFAELAAHPDEVLVPVRKALRAAYIVTLPAAAATVIVGPRLLELFGRGYSLHGRYLLQWGAASGLFFCLNYVSDIVLLARKKLLAYTLVNVIGSAAVLTSLLVAVGHGLPDLGFGWFIGQACYCAVSCIALVGYVGRRDLRRVLSGVLR